MRASFAVRGRASPYASLLSVILAVTLAVVAKGQATPFACLSTGIYATWYSPNTCAALGDLYNSARGASWTNKAGWVTAAAGTPTDYCTFYGITCTSGGSNKGLNVMCVPLALRAVRCVAAPRGRIRARAGC